MPVTTDTLRAEGNLVKVNKVVREGGKERPARNVCGWVVRPDGGRPGILHINHELYLITEQSFEYSDDGQGYAGRLWKLRKRDGTTYQLTINADGELACDCPDATYRHRQCKHCLAVRAAYEWVERHQQIQEFLAEGDRVMAGLDAVGADLDRVCNEAEVF